MMDNTKPAPFLSEADKAKALARVDAYLAQYAGQGSNPD